MPVPASSSRMSRSRQGWRLMQILALAAAIDAAGDVHVAGVDGQLALAVVERERDFGGAERAAGGAAVEDDVGHLLAAERLGALRAEHPFDGVDDVRFAGAVGPDDDRDAAREIEPRAIGEALEAGEFERFEHGGVEGRESSVESQEAAGSRLSTLRPSTFLALLREQIRQRRRDVERRVLLGRRAGSSNSSSFGVVFGGFAIVLAAGLRAGHRPGIGS